MPEKSLIKINNNYNYSNNLYEKTAQKSLSQKLHHEIEKKIFQKNSEII